MMNSLTKVTALLTCVISTNAIAQPIDSDDARAPIYKAPRFTVLDMNGKLRSTNDLIGKKYLLLTFFPKCFTFNCTNQITSLRDVYPQLRDNDIEVWAVSTDEAKGKTGQKAYAEHLKLPFLLLPDPSRKICLLYGAVNNKQQMAARMTVFIDKKGTVRWVDKQMYPPTHGKDVLERLNEEGYISKEKGVEKAN